MKIIYKKIKEAQKWILHNCAPFSVMASLFVIITAFLVGISGYYSNESNQCSQDVMEMLMNRSNTEFQIVDRLLDRNVNFLDRNMDYILNEKDKAKQNDDLGKNQTKQAVELSQTIAYLDADINTKRAECTEYYIKYRKYFNWSLYILILDIFITQIKAVLYVIASALDITKSHKKKALKRK